MELSQYLWLVRNTLYLIVKAFCTNNKHDHDILTSSWHSSSFHTSWRLPAVYYYFISGIMRRCSVEVPELWEQVVGEGAGSFNLNRRSLTISHCCVHANQYMCRLSLSGFISDLSSLPHLNCVQSVIVCLSCNAIYAIWVARHCVCIAGCMNGSGDVPVFISRKKHDHQVHRSTFGAAFKSAELWPVLIVLRVSEWVSCVTSRRFSVSLIVYVGLLLSRCFSQFQFSEPDPRESSQTEDNPLSDSFRK